MTLAIDSDMSASIRRLSKRPKTSLNARFDRMVNQVNLTLEESGTPVRRGRTRTSSAGSSSVSSSFDLPKTPVDKYTMLDEGRLGIFFSLIRDDRSRVGYYRAGEESDDDSTLRRVSVSLPSSTAASYDKPEFAPEVTSSNLAISYVRTIRTREPSSTTRFAPHFSELGQRKQSYSSLSSGFKF